MLQLIGDEDLREQLEHLQAAGVDLKVLAGAGAFIDTSEPGGRSFFLQFAAFIDLEREMVSARTTEGVRVAQARHQHCGRSPKLSDDQVEWARARVAQGATRAATAEELGVTVNTLRVSMRRAP